MGAPWFLARFYLVYGDFGLVLDSFEGYLLYKMIASQNVSSEAQVKNFFISQKNYVLFSRYSSFCIFNHSMILHTCDIIMSIST